MAKAVLVPNAIVPEVLNKHNYVDWSELVQSYLEAKGLWDVVKPSNPDDHDDDRDRDEAWRKKNAAALHAIKISCGPDTLSVIRGIRSARTAWDILEAAPFVVDAALTACAHGTLSPRELATG